MKIQTELTAAVSLLFCLSLSALAQGTAFTYQGRLNNGNAPANGSYDMAFTLYNTNSTGVPLAGPVTNSAVTVSNGLFTTAMDFGPGVFTGASSWLEIAISTNGANNFTTLAPRQPLTPVPYALFASSANAAGLTGTIPTALLPATVVTNGAGGLTLNGVFGGNGSGLTNLDGSNLAAGSVGTAQLAAGTLSAPASVAANSFAAVADTSYVITNSGAVTIFLPTTASIGDVVQVTGEGAGGWTAEEFNPALWSTVTLPAAYCGSLATSSDGTRLVAAVGHGPSQGGIYTSTNSGANWTLTGAPVNQNWASVASSSDGTHLVAALGGGGDGIYVSTNSGATWTLTGAPTSQAWGSVASSADGVHLLAGSGFGHIYVSTNSGSTWTPSGPAAKQWTSVASSADGTHLVAVAFSDGVYTSADSGLTWTKQTSAPTSAAWYSVASSSDGAHLVAVINGGGIYFSTNSGTNWTQASAPNDGWACVASSSDGTNLIAGIQGGALYLSTNAGANWTLQAMGPAANWVAVASAANGAKLYAVSFNPQAIFTNGGFSLVSSGSSGTSAAQQYLGNGLWQAVTTSPSGLPGNLVTNTESGVTLSGTFGGTISGSGTGLTALNAANLTGALPAISGVNLTSLPANAALLNASQTFTGQNNFSSNVGIGTATPGESLSIVTLTTDTNATAKLSLAASGGRKWIMESVSGYDTNSTGAGDLKIVDTTPGAGTRLTIDASGNVSGILVNTSDVHAKEKFAPVDTRIMLAKLAALPITEWSYKTSEARHLGPMAQDFRATFGLGSDDKGIATVDEGGVALAAIQGLNQRVAEKEIQIQRQESRIQELETRLKQIEKLLETKDHLWPAPGNESSAPFKGSDPK